MSPDAPHTADAHVPPRFTEQSYDPSIAVPAELLRGGDNSDRQPLFIGLHHDERRAGNQAAYVKSL